MEAMPQEQTILTPRLHLVAWEITRRCNLVCAHCRASALDQAYSDEFSTEECFRVVDEIAAVASPILILTGGEPLMRPDLFKIGSYAAGKGLKVVLGTNGTLLTEEACCRLKAVPITRIGVSLDFPVAERQDQFRGKSGAFEAVMKGIGEARKAGIEVQINSTISRLNVDYLDDLLAMALRLGAVAFHPFLLVPTGRGKGLADKELSPADYERVLNWIYDKQAELGDRIFFKPTDAPHYMRIVSQRNARAPERPAPARPAARGRPMSAMTRGCLAGVGFCFISHRGRVQGCGYLDVEAGDLRRKTFGEVWKDSPVFNRLRDLSGIKGKCGACEYRRACGGCRARAYEKTGDYLAEEPYCVYVPASLRSGSKPGASAGAGRQSVHAGGAKPPVEPRS